MSFFTKNTKDPKLNQPILPSIEEDSGGNFNLKGVKKIEKSAKSFLETPSVAFILVCLLALADFVSLYGFTESISYFSPQVMTVIAITAAFLLELLPTICAKYVHLTRYKKTKAYTAVLPLLAFFLLLAGLTYLRVANVLYGTSASDVGIVMSGMTLVEEETLANTSVDPVGFAMNVVLLSIMNLSTSVASFFLGYISSNPIRNELAIRKELSAGELERMSVLKAVIQLLKELDLSALNMDEDLLVQNHSAYLESLRNTLYARSISLLETKTLSEAEIAALADRFKAQNS